MKPSKKDIAKRRSIINKRYRDKQKVLDKYKQMYGKNLITDLNHHNHLEIKEINGELKPHLTPLGQSLVSAAATATVMFPDPFNPNYQYHQHNAMIYQPYYQQKAASVLLSLESSEDNTTVASKAELNNQDEEKRMMEVKETEKNRKDDEESRALVRLSSSKDDSAVTSQASVNTPVQFEGGVTSNEKLPATPTVELRSVSAVKPSKDASLGLVLKKVGRGYEYIQVVSIAPTSIFYNTALRVGDVVYSINGLTFTSFEEGLSWLKTTPGQLTIKVASPPVERRCQL